MNKQVLACRRAYTVGFAAAHFSEEDRIEAVKENNPWIRDFLYESSVGAVAAETLWNQFKTGFEIANYYDE